MKAYLPQWLSNSRSHGGSTMHYKATSGSAMPSIRKTAKMRQLFSTTSMTCTMVCSWRWGHLMA